MEKQEGLTLQEQIKQLAIEYKTICKMLNPLSDDKEELSKENNTENILAEVAKTWNNIKTLFAQLLS